MSNVRWSVWALLLAACGGSDTDTSDSADTANETGTAGPAGEADLDALLAGSHEGIPLTAMSTGHLTVSVGTPVGTRRFLVDSGASTTVVTPQLASALGVSGPSGQLVNVPGLSVGSLTVGAPVIIVDLAGTNQQFVGAGEPAIDGILGAPFLNGSEAVISYPGRTLYLSASGAPTALAKQLRDALAGSGYDTVAADVNVIQFVELPDVSIDGSSELTTIVDTGAGATLVELSAAIRLGLQLDELPGGGAATIGGAVDTYVTSVNALSFGDHALTDRSLLVVDLSDINGQLTGAGLAPIEVIVGADVLHEQEAVLDYVGGRLFLQPE